MSNKELQEEEIEVLRSIYDGDENFKEINSTTFQYKYGEEGTNKALMVEIVWGEDYPAVPPIVNMDMFYNKNIIDSVKKQIIDGVLAQADDLLESGMTYSLLEWVKENYDDLVVEQSDNPIIQTRVEEKTDKQDQSQEAPSKKKEKKEQLTKNQKRRLYEKMGNATGEMPRGWDWVDIVKHLSQSGYQKD